MNEALREGGNFLGSLKIDQLYAVLQDAVLGHLDRFAVTGRLVLGRHANSADQNNRLIPSCCGRYLPSKRQDLTPTSLRRLV